MSMLRKPLTSAEKRKLSKGELVVRPTKEKRGPLKLLGGASWQVIDLPAEAVWRAVLDVYRYRHMLPKVSESRVIGGQPSAKLAFIRHHYGPVDVSYRLRLMFQESDRVMMFQLDDRHPHSIRAGWGFMRVRAYGNGKSVLSFGVMVDVGPGVLGNVVGARIHEWILKIPRTMKKYVEGRGRTRYAG